MSVWVYGIATAVMGVGGYLGYLMFEAKARPIAPPVIPVDEVALTTFASELRAIDLPAGPNYRSGEYPLVPRHAAVEDEVSAEPVEADPDQGPTPGPWWAQPTVAVADERTPIFGESGSYPVLELDLSPTNAWNSADRAALRAALRMPEEDAA